MNGELEAQQEDTFRNLSASVSLPPSQDIFQSVFMVTNGGGTTIAKHQLFCNVNSIIIGGHYKLKPMAIAPLRSSAETIAPGGDAESETCLENFESGNVPFDCGDMDILMMYSLETQPNVTRQKEFRFVIQKGQAAWTKQPVNSKVIWCRCTWPS
jgi:hypothetical protein